MAHDDLETARRALDGDPQAMQDILDLCETSIQRVILSMLRSRSREDKEEVLQESRFALVRSLRTFRNDGEGGLKSFAGGIARFQALRYLRKKDHDLVEVQDPQDPVSPVAAAQANAPLPELELIGTEKRVRLETHLRENLPSRDFLVFVMLLQDHHSPTEVARILGIALKVSQAGEPKSAAAAADALGVARNNIDQIVLRIRKEIRRFQKAEAERE